MADSTHSTIRTRQPRLAATAAMILAALIVAWIIGPTARLVVLVGMLIIAATCAGHMAGTDERRPAPADTHEDPGDDVAALVDQGMRDLSRYLEHHAAFAAYLAGRSSESAPDADSTHTNTQRRRAPAGAERKPISEMY